MPLIILRDPEQNKRKKMSSMQDIRDDSRRTPMQMRLEKARIQYFIQSCVEYLLEVRLDKELVNLRLELGSESANLLAGGLERLSHVLADGRGVHVLDLLVRVVSRVGLGDSLELLQTVLALRVLDLVATSSNELGVVGATTTVPGENLFGPKSVRFKAKGGFWQSCLRWPCPRGRHQEHQQWRWRGGRP
jgi:hypothetical protein